jgi:hypothetical protein
LPRHIEHEVEALDLRARGIESNAVYPAHLPNIIAGPCASVVAHRRGRRALLLEHAPPAENALHVVPHFCAPPIAGRVPGRSRSHPASLPR